jgi:hypothetical protein
VSPGLTVTLRAVGVVIDPSVALTLVAPLLNSRIAPPTPSPATATPALNWIWVEPPKPTSAPLESATVGALPPELEEAPEKTRLWAPVWPVAVLP